MKSGLISILSSAFKTSSAMNSQLVRPFWAAFFLAASTASATISTPITLLATGDNICAIVPVPVYRSYITGLLSATSPNPPESTYSLALE